MGPGIRGTLRGNSTGKSANGTTVVTVISPTTVGTLTLVTGCN